MPYEKAIIRRSASENSPWAEKENLSEMQILVKECMTSGDIPNSTSPEHLPNLLHELVTNSLPDIVLRFLKENLNNLSEALITDTLKDLAQADYGVRVSKFMEGEARIPQAVRSEVFKELRLAAKSEVLDLVEQVPSTDAEKIPEFLEQGFEVLGTFSADLPEGHSRYGFLVRLADNSFAQVGESLLDGKNQSYIVRYRAGTIEGFLDELRAEDPTLEKLLSERHPDFGDDGTRDNYVYLWLEDMNQAKEALMGKKE